MGIDPDLFDKSYAAEHVTIDLTQQRMLGMHLAEYAERHDLTKTELRELLGMIGL